MCFGVWHEGSHGNGAQDCIPGAGLGDAAFCGHRGHCRPTRRSPYQWQPLQEADLAHRGHDPPFDQAAADGLVRGHLSGRDGEERHLVGGTGPPFGGQARDGLDDEAEDHGRDGPVRKAAVGSDADGRRPSRRRAFGRQVGSGRTRQDAVRGRGSDRPRRPAAQGQAGRPGRGLPQARERTRRKKCWPAPDAEVVTDALGCRTALGHAGRSHRAIRTGSGRGAFRMAPFKRVNATLGNIKGAITGTYPKLGPDHAERHPAGFAWRCNRRHHLRTMIPRFLHGAARTRPIPYHALIAG